MLNLKVTNLSDAKTVYPTQFSFDIIDHPVYKTGYMRYRHGFLRVELYGEKAPEGWDYEERMFGIRLTHDESGEIDFDYAVKVLRSNVGLNLKWDKVAAPEEE